MDRVVADSTTKNAAASAAAPAGRRNKAAAVLSDHQSLIGVLESLERDPSFKALANGDIEQPESKTDPSIIVGVPSGLRPAIAAAAAAARHTAVVLVVASSREAEETVESLRSWYEGDPNAIAQFEAWETLPHERLSPRADTVASRMAVMRRLKHPQPGSDMFGPIQILVMPVRSLIQPVVAGLGDVEPLVFEQGRELPLDEAAGRLVENAYTRVDLVMDRGEFAVRGGILDVFPPTAPHPVRIEFFGDEIDSIREFHASDQRTYGDDVPRIWATPCRELQLNDAVRERAKSLIGRIPNADDMLESIANAIPVEGMESLMPALIDDMEPVAGLLPDNALMLLSDPEKLRRAAEDLTKTANEFLAASWHVAAAGHGAGAPISFEQASFLDYDETISALEFSRHEVIQLTSFGVDASRPGHVQLDAQDPAQFRGDEAKASHGIESLIADGYAVTVTSPAQGTLSRLKRVINETGITKFECVRSHAIDGFVDNAAKVALLTERDITGRTSAGAQAKTPKRRRKAIDLVELKTGDYIVHEQHGIGRFVEMKQRTIGVGANKTTREYLVIEYAPSKRNAPPDKLFIPTDQLDQVSKYIGAEAPKLNKLGGSDWAATKAKARKHVHEIAEDLVKLYSARQSTAGFAFSPDTPWQKELEDAFPYQETADQLTTIDEVKADMEKSVPMDRLICGDVGFGKTEIAVRAAFKAIQDGKQVAVLVPTTLLVQQHYETFTERYEGFPVKVAALSRFQSTKEINETLKGLADGTVDLVIGTHKLLNPKIKFKDLGLLVIDEEQRFGVEHKETLKALRTNVDVLSLSATPIPRTLEMAVTGIREMSTLATPPEDRLPVLTYVGAYEDAQVKASINRELLRGGQVFYVHNRVEDIGRVSAKIHELVPEARIGVAHGKMGEKQLDGVIRDFWHRDVDVLLCTTIIETGLDISNANTLLVDHADRFGLSQLHQLRGRVGRGRERAYAYFLYDPAKPMTQQSHDRLETIAQNTALGSGFDVAMKDLELRGTGNLLGGEQSGHIEGVGFDLYVRMVSEAVEQYKEPERHEPVAVTIDLPIEASIPVDYIDSDKLRLEAYRKLAAARSEQDLADLREELADRYGALPQEFETLFDVARLRAKARELGISEIVTQGSRVRVGKIDPPESLQMRMSRIYRGMQYRPVTHTMLIPAPFAGSLGSAPMSSEQIMHWAEQLLEDLAWKGTPRG
ncbi:transcription-repair coupling factor [Bifidobacterium tibiigranuli]|jgi:transcription-repair coupling factor (superfamily II helicase)|uniref:transcription-repair coupling factor n=1 Tax=Bifidobacterium tibiigranuli TaxID=2172043 RepID=UPI0026EF9EE1|nr:transcription-repair coupling factor [Bifidobacterium tibiigranuli]MCI1650519.1 transcription-repair coupling factor [Bifidobacterium tibiigranuli]MCI2185672.1 transcription-repair coupling factor [Bifidobacterium tibiigranuli]MCI2202982.1 transcription-repair coupling factor [Bifidobacterium tibiigranuli]